MFNIIGKRPLFFTITAVLLAGSAIALAVLGLEPGIDFSSGSITTLNFEQAVNPDELEDEITALGFTQVSRKGSKPSSDRLRKGVLKASTR